MTTDEQRLAWAIPWLELAHCPNCNNCYNTRAAACPVCSNRERSLPSTWAGKGPAEVRAARGEEE